MNKRVLTLQETQEARARRLDRWRNQWVMMMVLLGMRQFARSLHVRWYLYFPLVFVAGAAAFTIGVVAYEPVLSLLPRRDRPLPRAAYALLACCWLAVAAACLLTGRHLPQSSWSSWQSNALGVSFFASLIIAVVMACRAAVRGPVRRAFWLRPPRSL
jgi:hypothetical protein